MIVRFVPNRSEPTLNINATDTKTPSKGFLRAYPGNLFRHEGPGPRGQARAPLVVHRIPSDRTGHAVTTASTAAEFRADDGNHLDALLAQQGVGVGIAIVSEDDAGRRTDQIGATVPLCTLAHIGAAAGLDDAQLLQAQRFRNDL